MKYSNELNGIEKRKFSQAKTFYLVDFSKGEIARIDKNDLWIENGVLKIKGRVLIDDEVYDDEDEAKNAFVDQMVTKLELVIEKELSTIGSCHSNIKEAKTLIEKLKSI